jgi:putative transposase
MIRDDDEFGRYAEYCMINPVKHGYVRKPVDWPHSSFHRDLRRGNVTEDWGADIDMAGDWGER